VPRGGPKLEGAALFFFPHKLILQAASFFFEGNFVTKKKKGEGGRELRILRKYIFLIILLKI
jgi:hypothetical protein